MIRVVCCPSNSHRLRYTLINVSLIDSHLVALQTLSAHMKLLLDAPEYLWRLIERKKYMHASWLFLLSRVAHQGLVSQDDIDDQSWSSEGIDVLVSWDSQILLLNTVLTPCRLNSH